MLYNFNYVYFIISQNFHRAYRTQLSCIELFTPEFLSILAGPPGIHSLHDILKHIDYKMVPNDKNTVIFTNFWQTNSIAGSFQTLAEEKNGFFLKVEDSKSNLVKFKAFFFLRKSGLQQCKSRKYGNFWVTINEISWGTARYVTAAEQ